jgi:hypothetical protein
MPDEATSSNGPPTASAPTALLSTVMTERNLSNRQTRTRLLALATLAAFLVGQSWMVCAPLCLLEGHAKIAAASEFQNHPMHCHSDNVTERRLPTAQPLDSMLAARVAPLLPPHRFVAVAFIPPAPVELQQIPLADPPPPRPA